MPPSGATTSSSAAFDGRVAGQHRQPGARRVALPAPAPAAQARRAVGVDDHVPELAGEAVGAVLQRTAGDQAAADAGAERDEDDVVDARRRAEPPLGERRAGGVVVDRDVASEALLEAARATSTAR